MNNSDRKISTDRVYYGHRNGGNNYPAQPHSANSFLRHSQHGNIRQSWTDELQRKTTIRLENVKDKMKKLDLAYEKKQKAQQTNGRQFLRHTIDFPGKGYQPDESREIGRNYGHYQSKNTLRKYTADDVDSLDIGRHSKAYLNDYQPNQIDSPSRYQRYASNKPMIYRNIGQTNEEELNYQIPRTAKSPSHRVLTEGQDYVYQNQNNSVYSGSRTGNQYHHHSSSNTPYADEKKVTRANTFNFEKKYDTTFSKKSPYQYYTPKYDDRDEIFSPTARSRRSPNKAGIGMESPRKSSATSNPTSVSSSVKNNEPYVSKYDGYSPMTSKFTGSNVGQDLTEQNPRVNINITKQSVALVARKKDHKALSLNDFQMGKCLGEGKFGNVYIAVHKDTRSIFALKKIKKDQIREHKLQKQFMMEIKMQLYFDHKNVLTLYGFFDDETYVYLVLEYMEEGTLFSYMKKEKKLSESDASRKLKELLEAVHYLHEMNIAHRDIKPENIVISNGVCKLCDFGWSAICDERRTTLCMTIDFIAPQVLKGEEYGTEADLWCIGVLCYQVLVGKAPFYHTKIKQTMKKIVNVDTVGIKLPSDMSLEAQDFISNLIVYDPDKRMSTEDALAHPWIVKYREEDALLLAKR